MKTTFEKLDDVEAMERFGNWITMNFKLSQKEIEDRLNTIAEKFGQNRVLDMAYFVQYAMRSQIDYFTIFKMVSEDFTVASRAEVRFNTFHFATLYKEKAIRQYYALTRQNEIKRAA